MPRRLVYLVCDDGMRMYADNRRAFVFLADAIEFARNEYKLWNAEKWVEEGVNGGMIQWRQRGSGTDERVIAIDEIKVYW